jgi:pre-mRNA-splicing factor 18
MADRLADLDFRGASDAYVSISVGNQPWLIGVSQVGIHERAAREKVYQGKITHVLNDETQRRYITSLKRLHTFLLAKVEGLERGAQAHPGAL